MSKIVTKLDDKILEVLGDAESHGEWDIAFRLYDWTNSNLRSKHGAWIRSIVQSLWRMYRKGWVSYFWISHGEGVPGDRMWFRSSEEPNLKEQIRGLNDGH